MSIVQVNLLAPPASPRSHPRLRPRRNKNYQEENIYARFNRHKVLRGARVAHPHITVYGGFVCALPWGKDAANLMHRLSSTIHPRRFAPPRGCRGSSGGTPASLAMALVEGFLSDGGLIASPAQILSVAVPLAALPARSRISRKETQF